MSEALQSELLISLKGLKHRWGEGFELSIPQWQVPQGARVALIGSSGAGKSTLMMILAGVLAPQEGEVWVLGAPLHAMSEAERRAWRARHVGLLAQEFALLNHLSAAHNVTLPLELGLRAARRGAQDAQGAQGELSELLRRLGVEALKGRAPDQLSQGERQRFALARALLASPPLLLADEPTAHLDPHSSQGALELLHERCGAQAHPQDHLQDQPQGGLLLITHDHSALSSGAWSSCWRLEAGRLEPLEPSAAPLEPSATPLEPSAAPLEPSAAPLEPSAAPREPSALSQTLTLSLMAWRAVRRYWGRSLLLALTLALTLSPPLALSTLSERLERRLLTRAQESPLVLGAPGSRFDLTLGALYFRGAKVSPLTWGDLKQVYRETSASAAPLHLGLSAGGAPLVGTTPEYYELRGLTLSEGRLPQRVGEVVLGSRAAQALKLSVGDALMSDQADLYNLAATYPITLSVVGVLTPTQRPDDEALFTDIKSAWVILGLGHGHEAATQQVGAEVVTRQALDEQALKELHFHGDLNSFPVSAILISPRDEREGSLFKGRAARREGWRVISPRKVIEELLALIFKVRGALEALAYLALALTLSLSALVAWLSVSLRASEWSSLALLGLSRAQVRWAAGAELAWVALGALTLIALGALALSASEAWLWALLLGS